VKKIKVAIIGVTGYAGEELLRILLNHPAVEITYLGAKIEKDTPIGEIFPQFSSLHLLCHSEIDKEEVLKVADTIFLALPHGVSLQYVPYFYASGKTIIDLSADYRFDSAEIYEKYYLPHNSPQLLKEKVYGLPELYREKIKKSKLIANPGCYPTGVILGLAPAVKEGWINTESIVVDAKSGVTGAGRSLKPQLLYSEVNEDFKAYAVGTHRHQPEMEQEIAKLGNGKSRILFIPHLAPYNRGIFSTIYADLKVNVSSEEVWEKYSSFYKEEPFVKILPPEKFPSVKEVRGTNLCLINVRVEERTGKLVILTVIDNLTKGASGQAVQNFNLIMGLPETMGLENSPYLP